MVDIETYRARTGNFCASSLSTTTLKLKIKLRCKVQRQMFVKCSVQTLIFLWMVASTLTLCVSLLYQEYGNAYTGMTSRDTDFVYSDTQLCTKYLFKHVHEFYWYILENYAEMLTEMLLISTIFRSSTLAVNIWIPGKNTQTLMKNIFNRTVHGTCSYLIGNVGSHAYHGNPPKRSGEDIWNLHSAMIFSLSQEIEPDTGNGDIEKKWNSFTNMLFRPDLLSSVEVARLKSIYDVFRILMDKGKIDYGNYEVVKRIMSQLQLRKCLNIITEHEEKMKFTSQNGQNKEQVASTSQDGQHEEHVASTSEGGQRKKRVASTSQGGQRKKRVASTSQGGQQGDPCKNKANGEKALACYTVTLNKNTYKKCFEITIEAVQRRNFTSCQTKYIMKQLNFLSREKPQYCIYDTMFALCLTLFSKRQRLAERLTKSRLFALTQSVCLRTSSPSQATCLLQCMLAHCLQKNGRLFESLHILTENLRQSDLDTVCTFNCHRLLDIIDAMCEAFEDSNDDRFLDAMLTHIYEGFTQRKAIDSISVDDLTKRFRKNASYFVLKKSQSQLPKDSALSANVNLLEAILKGNVSECRLAIDKKANVNKCLHALLQTIKLSKHVIYIGNDLYNHCASSVLRHQNKIIKYLLTTGVNDDAIEQGICNLYIDDSRRKTLLNGICRLLEKEPTRLNLDKETFPLNIQYGRRCNEHGVQNCFLVHVNVYQTISDSWYAGTLVIFRNALKVSSEGIKVENSQLRKKCRLSDEENEIFRDIITEHGEYLWSTHSNLNMISACPVKSFEEGSKLVIQPCIVFYCSFKGFIPNIEPKFPETLSTQNIHFPVDVREGQFHLGGLEDLKRPTQFLSPLIVGGSVGLADRKTKGTIGPFIEFGDQKIGFLTCAHVFFDIPLKSTNNFGQDVFQPVFSEIEDIPPGKLRRCGRIFDAKFDCKASTGIDIALVKIIDRFPEDGSFAFSNKDQITQAGFDEDSPPSFTSGSVITDLKEEHKKWKVIKFGSKTGLTTGNLDFEHAQVLIKMADITYNEHTDKKKIYRLKNMYEVHSGDITNVFFQRGDSGAGVFIVDKHNQLHCIGIAVGCTSSGAAIVIPIGPVLQGFNLDSLKKF